MSARLQFSFAHPPRSAPYLVTVTMPCLVFGTFLPSSLSTASYVIVTCPMYYKSYSLHYLTQRDWYKEHRSLGVTGRWSREGSLGTKGSDFHFRLYPRISGEGNGLIKRSEKRGGRNGHNESDAQMPGTELRGPRYVMEVLKGCACV